MADLLFILKKQIDMLEQQINLQEQPEYAEHYFDEHLFNTNKIEVNSSFYLDKIKQTYQTLSTNVKTQKFEQILYLSESLVNQITALTREVATHNLRQKDVDIIDETLYEKHSRHLDYLRRLQEMKYELEFSPESINHSKIASLDNRIYRCEQAIKKIELEMENDSNPSAKLINNLNERL
jgi:Primosomal replication protein N''''